MGNCVHAEEACRTQERLSHSCCIEGAPSAPMGVNSSGMAGAPCRIVVLVHGTFTNARRFQRRARLLCESLKREHGAFLVHFCWTGKNRYSAREGAAIRLGRRLERLRRANPRARISVVAHSHGGNVVVPVLAHSRPGDLVDRVVFMATPFLTVRPLGSFAGAEVASYFAKILFAAAGSFAIALLLRWLAIHALAVSTARLHVSAAESALRWVTANPEFVLLILLVGWVLVWWAMVRVYGILLGTCVDKASQVLRSQTIDAAWASSVLIVRPHADEASGILVTSQFLSFLSNRLGAMIGTALHDLGDIPERLAHRLPNLSMRWKRLLWAAWIGTIVWAFYFTGGLVDQLLSTGMRIFLWIQYAAMAVLVGIGIIAILRSIPAVVLVVAFGWDLLGIGWLLEVSSEATPPGVWTTYLVRETHSGDLDDRSERVLPLSHAQVYSRPDVIDQIIRWLSNPPTDTVGDP
jgi:hypothetical protein